MSRRVLVRLAWVLLATALCLGLLEWGASFLVELPSAQLALDKRLHHTQEPYYEGATMQEAVDYEVRFNGQGWREDYDVAKKKPAGTYRIFYVGDSFTKGIVPVDYCVPNLVEAALTADTPPGVTYEVINAGVGSYSPIIYYILIRYFLMDYEPDLVVISVDMTDVADDWRYHQAMVFDEEGNPWGVPTSKVYWREFVTTPDGVVKADLPSRIRFFLLNESHLYRYVSRLSRDQEHKEMVHKRRRELLDESQERAENRVRFSWCGYDWDDDLEEDVRFSMDVLARTFDFCAENGVRVLITGVPHFQQFEGDIDRPTWSFRPHEEIERVAREHGVAYFDSRAALALVLHGTRHDEYYNQGDFHLNSRGNELWAAAHLEALRDPANGLLPTTAD